MNKIKILFILLFTSSFSYGQYGFEIGKKDILEIMIKSLSMDEIKKDSVVVVRMNGITSSLPSFKEELEGKEFKIKIFRDKKIYSHLILDYIDFNLINITPNIAYIKYINRHKAMAIHLVFHKKVTNGWGLVDKFVWKEVSFKYDDFLYDTIKKEKLKKKN